MISCIFIIHNIKGRDEIITMTEECLNTFHETTKGRNDLSVTLIDNGSNDEGRALDFLVKKRELFHQWNVTRYDENRPIADCWNGAIYDAQQSQDVDRIVLLNNDVVFNREGWLDKLLEPLSDPSVGVSGSKMMTWNGFTFLEGAFMAFDLDQAIKIVESTDEEILQVFDPRFKFTCEEVDFCYRMINAGFRLAETKIEELGYVTHLHHGTLSWSNHEGGWNGQSILNVMHQGRKDLCKKYGKEEYVND